MRKHSFQARRVRHAAVFAAAYTAFAATGCSGSSGGVTPHVTSTAAPQGTATPQTTATPQVTATPVPTATPAASPTASGSAPTILVAGAKHTFTGSETTSVVYAAPSPGQANFTATSTFTDTTTFSLAPSGSPATYDVNEKLAYTVTQPAKAGLQTLSLDTDVYENQTMSGNSTTVSETAYKDVITANDVDAGNAGGGPYTLTTNDTSSYTTPFTVGVYPLQTGSSVTEPLARTFAATFTDEAASGATPPPSYEYETSENSTYNNDGSFSITPRKYSNGAIRDIEESSNGSAHQANTTSSLAETIGVPVSSSGSFEIPVSETNSSGTNTATFKAADWYPGAALPPSPLESEIFTVKGPAASLPAGCIGAISEPNLVEIDEAHTDINVFGTYETESEQLFDSNGITVCVLRTTTTKDYAPTTGTLTQTTTENFAEALTSVTGQQTDRATHFAKR